jgi:hypothetical protein
MAALLVWRNSRLVRFGRSGAGYRVQFNDFLGESGNVEAMEGPTKWPAMSGCAYFMPSTEYKFRVPRPS